MYLSRYTISKPCVIVELDPATGEVQREFDQPGDWVWDPNRSHAHWEEYGGKRFFVYLHGGKLVLQTPAERHVLDETYSSELTRVRGLWLRFQLFKEGVAVYQFTYRDPQTRLFSFLSSLGNADDWWDWDTPFDYVHGYLAARSRQA